MAAMGGVDPGEDMEGYGEYDEVRRRCAPPAARVCFVRRIRAQYLPGARRVHGQAVKYSCSTALSLERTHTMVSGAPLCGRVLTLKSRELIGSPFVKNSHFRSTAFSFESPPHKLRQVPGCSVVWPMWQRTLHVLFAGLLLTAAQMQQLSDDSMQAFTQSLQSSPKPAFVMFMPAGCQTDPCAKMLMFWQMAGASMPGLVWLVDCGAPGTQARSARAVGLILSLISPSPRVTVPCRALPCLAMPHHASPRLAVVKIILTALPVVSVRRNSVEPPGRKSTVRSARSTGRR